MFGKQYANHLDILVRSFGQMNNRYQRVAQRENISYSERLKKLYLALFGIPEIGFQIRSLYFKKILDSYLFNKNPKKILDAGSGIGAYSFWLAKRFAKAEIIGGEIDKNKLRFCKKMVNELRLKNIMFVYFDITKIDNNRIYDMIVTIDVLEHIDKYKHALKNFYYLLHIDGYLYIHVPQPNQKRIFSTLKSWHHEDHAYEGIKKNILEEELKKIGFKIITSMETFGFFGKLAWEINHLTLAKSFVLAGIAFPFLYILARFDMLYKNKNGLGVSILAQKK